MIAPTHRAFGVAATSASLVVIQSVAPIYTSETAYVVYVQIACTLLAALVCSTIPDWDQYIPFIRHRGITHAIWIPALLGYACYHYMSQPYLFALLVGAFLGYTSHIVGDAFSNAGIAWLYPFQGYHGQPGGSFYVKGNRGPFIPLYSVGQSVGVNAALCWWVLSASMLFLLFTI